MEKDLYKAKYLQEPISMLTEENLELLEKHCKKAIHYERKDGILEHQITLDLLDKYKEQQAELEKKDKIINEMSKIISIAMTDIKVVKSQFEKEYCDFINSNEECCWKTDSDCTDCIKQYFERKVEDDIK